jgi:LDH2 family malate/lactate/ureidoglycolate dehydrogenase
MAGGSCNNPFIEQRQSFTLTVIDPAAFGDKDWYESEIRRMTGRVRSGRRREGFDAIRLPGERMLSQAAKSKRDGVDMPESIVRKLNEIAGKRAIEPLAAR